MAILYLASMAYMSKIPAPMSTTLPPPLVFSGSGAGYFPPCSGVGKGQTEGLLLLYISS
jgi:hypothetical protein